jgi:hypothetical protein
MAAMETRHLPWHIIPILGLGVRGFCTRHQLAKLVAALGGAYDASAG